MAHNLCEVDGKVSMAYTGKRPWHDLGTQVDGLMTVEEAMEKANLNYRVSKQPLFSKYQDSFINIDDNFAVVREDTKQVLGIVKGRYNVLQNIEAFDFFNPILGEGKAFLETVGALGKGEQIWGLARLPEDIKVNGHDVVNMYLNMSTTHDGSGSVTVGLTPVRVVCQNTLTIALNTMKSKVRIKHTNSMKAKLENAGFVLGFAKLAVEQSAKAFQAMAEKQLNEQEMDAYLSTLWPVEKDAESSTRRENIVKQAKELIYHGKGNEGKTAWDAYNGVIEYRDFYRTVKNGTNKWEAAMFSTNGVSLGEKAFQAAMALTA